MADHRSLYTGVLVVRAWGLDNFNALMKDSVKDITQGKIPLYPGVLYEADPGGGGGPYNEARNRQFEFRMDGFGLPGYPGEYPG